MKAVLLIVAICVSNFSFSQNTQLVFHLQQLSKLVTTGQLKEAIQFSDSIRKTISSKLQKTDTIYPYILFYSAVPYGLLNQYDKCEEIVWDLEKIVLKRYGKNDIKYFAVLNLHYLVYHRRNNFVKTIYYLEQCREILEKNLAQTSGQKTVHSFEATYDHKDIEYFLQTCLTDLGFSYIHNNNYEKGKSLMKESLLHYDESYAVNYDPQSHINHMTNYGTFYTYIEDLRSADSVYIELQQWAEKYYGNTHPSYGRVLCDLASFYYTIGDIKKTEALLLQARKTFEQSFQKKSHHYFEVLVLLGSIYFHTEEYLKLEPVILSVQRSLKDIGPEMTVDYTKFCVLLIRYHMLKNEPAKADSIMHQLDNMFYGKDFSFNYTYQTYLEVKSTLFANKRQFHQADSILALLINNAEKTGKVITTEYATLLLNRSKNFFQWGKHSMAKELLKKSIENVSENLRKNFLLLSENQKQFYLALTEDHFNELNKQAANHADRSIVETAYDTQLLLKGLLLKTSVLGNRNADTSYEYKQLFSKYLRVREALVYKYSGTDDDSKSLESLIEQTEMLEKQLSRMSPDFISRQFNPQTSKSIGRYLKEDEAAIEFFNFRSGDSVFYGAMMISNNSPDPVVIRLFEKRSFDEFLQKTKGNKSEESINIRYHHNNFLYSLIWQPLEEQLKGINKVYFSPSGILNKISIAALPVNDKTRLCDRYNLIQLNTTASIPGFADQTVSSADRIFLYGGVHYDGDTTALKQAVIQYNLTDVVSRSLPDDIERGNVWDYLSETKTEVENIGQLALANKLHATVITGWNATEESVKWLARNNSPEILHIATHGFFFPDPKKRTGKAVIKEGKVFRQSDNHLMRSGLILAGANYAWDNKPVTGVEDGILTAYEVSNLYFPNTKLAVLSACETGLGEVQSMEGVYGLQRAFKMAGVKNLIMSLWDVPDLETAEFMTLFYKNLFSGLAIEKAFRNTQLSMRNKYADAPYKWAAWILIK